MSNPVTAQATGTEVNDWSVRVRVDRNALGGSFAIGIFVVSPSDVNNNPDEARSNLPTKPSEWGNSDAFVGQVAVMPTSLPAMTPGSATDAGGGQTGTPLAAGISPVQEMMQGFVNLEDVLSDHLEHKTDTTTVIPYLQKALLWKASQPASVLQAGDDTETHLTRIPSLEVTVMSARLRGVEDQLPVYDDPVEHPQVTRGKVGGSRAAAS